MAMRSVRVDGAPGGRGEGCSYLGWILSKCQEELVLNRFSRWEAGTELQERLVGTVQKM